MLKEKEISSDCVYGEGDSSHSKITDHISGGNRDNSDEKIGSFEKGIDFFGQTNMDFEGSQTKPSKIGNSGSQELTLSYLCDNSKLGFLDKEIPERNLENFSEKVSYKGKEVASEDQIGDDLRWVERDFLQLNGNSWKREDHEREIDGENREKKAKLETLNLSLALPDVSLSLAVERVQNGDPPFQAKPSGSLQSLAISDNNTQATYSNDFTNASVSYSYSLPFSHNASCSLTLNSTENFENSVGGRRRDSDYIWNAGEGTNGSVHSRFRPVGDSVVLANQGGGAFPIMQNNRQVHKDSSISFYRATSSDNYSFLPSELPARPQLDIQSGDSRGRGSDHIRGSENLDRVRERKLSRPQRILWEIVSESVPVMAQIVQELSDEVVESTKEYLKNVIATPGKKEELLTLQNRLGRRSDLSSGSLIKSNRNQLEILIAIKMGLGNFLSSKNHLPVTELMEIFLLERCRNLNCKRSLPVEDCDCKICSNKKGFCSECMCPVCFNFDCASNTCGWVGCDVCAHWCHAACGIQRNIIKPGPSLKGPSGTSEMQFHCLGCGHASEMFGFVKDVFMSCAKSWGAETWVKELDCVSKVFRGSEDFKGKELQKKADEMLYKLENKILSSSEVCNFIFQFFTNAEAMSSLHSSTDPSKDLIILQGSLRKDATPLQLSNPLPPKSSYYNTGSSSGRQDMMLTNLHQDDLKASFMSEKVIEDEWSVKLPKKDGFESLESVVRVKDAEARMFQVKADEARKEAEGYKRMIRMKNEKLDEEYSEKLAKLCLQETEEKRRRKLEKLKVLESIHLDYYKMKLRMQGDVAGLLERMENTKQQLV